MFYRNTLFRLFVSIFLMALLIAPAVVGAAPVVQAGSGNAPTAVMDKAYALNVRSGPGVNYTVVTAIPRGTQVTLTGYRDAAAEWVTVRLPNRQEGWVNGRYLSTHHSYHSLQVLRDVQPPQNGQSEAMLAMVSGTNALNLRTGPGVGYMQITAIPWGTRVELTGYRDAAAEWVTVRLPNRQEGWVNGRYLSTHHSYHSLQVLRDVQPPQNGQSEAMLAMVSGTNALNLRTGPGIGYMQITAIPWGTRVELTGYRDAAAEWVTVRLPNRQEGWVNGRFLSTHHSYHSLRVLQDVQPPQPVEDGQSSSATATVSAVYALNVRTGPGIGYAVVAPVLRDTKLELTGYRDATTTWVSVRLPDGREGWTHSGYLNTSFPLHNLQSIR